MFGVSTALDARMSLQNVALQMGLRLETKGGAMITRVQRAVLRCDGCHAVSQDTSKLFCPSCGHASLARVSVTVGPEGVEQYGIRKKRVLRGTRCVDLVCSCQRTPKTHACVR
jgi:RNA-binding protein NOB1